MSFLKNIFGKKEQTIKTYQDFWIWFQQNEKSFASVVEQRQNIEMSFFNKVTPKLNQIKEGIYLLAGPIDENTIELVFTAEGDVKNFVFIEELVDSANKMEGWQFTALKPPLDIEETYIEMQGQKFNKENMSFYENGNPQYPDEIDITIVHNDLKDNTAELIKSGCYIFLDNYIGELNFVSTIDNIDFVKKGEAQKPLVPIEKLKDYLIWRQKEFIEKYEGTRHHTDDDNYTVMEAQLQSGMPLIAAINQDLMGWDAKASHPWILNIEIKFSTTARNGMPDTANIELLNRLEEAVLEELKDADGYLNIGRATANYTRDIYIACKDFRKPSKVLNRIQNAYSKQFNIEYNIYKDKYWRSLDHFREG